MLAACINAASLALVDAGVPMPDYLVACTAGLSSATTTATTTTAMAMAKDGVAEMGAMTEGERAPDPLLDLSLAEEQELPFVTVGTLGGSEKVSVLVMESRVEFARLEGMLAVGVDGCKQVREILDGVVRARGKRLLSTEQS